jgi:serine/threonine protein kinase
VVVNTRVPLALKEGLLIENPLTRDGYRLIARLGQGGFGTAFKAHLIREGHLADTVCLKVTGDSRGWHGEAFLGEFLRDSTRAVHILDAFPFLWVSGQQRKRRRMLFAVTSELMTAGTVADWCQNAYLPAWPEPRVRREIRLMLETLDHLHLNGVSHRDITPSNVFLGPRSTLKLGDFGIAALARLSRGAHADSYSPAFKPPNVTAYWTPADDVYQVGLLAMTLLKGDVVFSGVSKPEVNALTPSDRKLRDVIKTAVSSSRNQRFQDAHSMAHALR